MTKEQLLKALEAFEPPFVPEGLVNINDVSHVYKQDAIQISIAGTNVVVYREGLSEFTIERIKEAFDQFKLVKTRDVSDIYEQPAINIKIDKRDMTIAEDGEVKGQGTDLI
jgi:hypothetical protein